MHLSPVAEMLQEKRCKFSAPSTCDQAGETLCKPQPSVRLSSEAFRNIPTENPAQRPGPIALGP